ncbi:unnamed protein product, partial [Ectocarpus sp. 12 AP-2014]
YRQSRGDFIIVGDLMRSVSLLVYKAVDGAIEEVARDYHANWMTAVEMLNDDVYIGGEADCNIFTLRRNAGKHQEARLEIQGEFHLGEFVNKFCRGSLLMQVNTIPLVKGQPLLFGTVNGMVGTILTL